MYSEAEVQAATLAYFNNDELATQVWISKYALRDSEGLLLELTPDDMHWRLAREFARIEQNYPNPLSADQIYDYLKNFDQIVPQGSGMYGIGNPKPVSLSNCLVTSSPTDDLPGIFEAGKNLALLLARRCGVGIDLSHLRPEDTPVNNAANTSSGAWSFANYYSDVIRMIAQRGRRGAGMITLDVRHPDIYQFVTSKHDLTKVTGANISIKLTDDFMQAVEKDEEFTLQWPVDSPDPKVTRTIQAKELWDIIVDSARKTAEPGILMWDNICKMLPAHCYPKFVTISTNPCSELPLSANDSCRLISICLFGFVRDAFTPQAYFDYTAFAEAVQVGLRLSDDLVDLEIEKLKQIQDACDEADAKKLWQQVIDAAAEGRRTGLGIHGLADTLVGLGITYGSDEAIAMVDKIGENFKINAYTTSVVLAEERGAFDAFDGDREKDCKFFASFPEGLLYRMARSGRRNISLLTCAPTGSVSILCQVNSGIEPFFRLAYIRRRKLNPNDTTSKVDFVDALGDKWTEYTVYAHAARRYMETNNTLELPACFIESNNIDWEAGVYQQAALQQHIDHAISRTVNLPEGTPNEVVSQVYLLGWKLGLKGITVYVDGSRDGVLITQGSSNEETWQYTNAPKRPETLPCVAHTSMVEGQPYTFFVGLHDGKPFELFGGQASDISVPNEELTLGKVPRKTLPARYELRCGHEVLSKNLVDAFHNPDHGVHTRLISLALRHGAQPSFVVEQLMKGDTQASLRSFSKACARVLKNYIKDGTQVTGEKHCPECGSTNLIYQDGCVSCTDCGYAKCG